MMLLLLGGSGSRWSPRSVPGLKLWLAGDRLALGDGAAVATWPDASGNGYDAAQGDPAKRPVYRAGVLNGRGVVEFDGVNDHLALSGAGLGILRNAPGGTVVCVLQTTVAGEQWPFFAAWGPSGATRFGLTRNYTVAGTIEVRARRVDAGGPAEIHGGVVAGGTWRIESAVVDYSLARAWLYQGGTQVAAGDPFLTAGNSADTNSFSAMVGSLDGTGGYLKGQIAEMLVWGRALPVAVRRRVDRYLGRKYGLAV